MHTILQSKKFAYLNVIDFLQAEVSQAKNSVHAPQCELSHRVAIQVYCQVVQAPDAGQGIDLLQAVDVGSAEHQSLPADNMQLFLQIHTTTMHSSLIKIAHSSSHNNHT